jgi:lactoylglutathione lyase
MKSIRILILHLLLAGFAALGMAQEIKHDETMKDTILGLRTCIYTVPDLEAAKKWYTSTFGKEPYFDEPFYVGFNIGGYELGLLPSEKQPDDQAENVRTYWGVENVQQVFDTFVRQGAKVHEAPHNVGGPLVVATVMDPWGNLIGFIYNPEFKAE